MTPTSRGKDDPDGPVSKGKRTGKINRVIVIKGKVESGKYRVQPKKVADKMVDDAIREIRSRGH